MEGWEEKGGRKKGNKDDIKRRKVEKEKGHGGGRK